MRYVTFLREFLRFFFFFKQKTAYEIRPCDWSSDVCSSDLMDSVPTVFVTGQVRSDLIGTDGFQEADTFGMTMPIVKHSFMIADPREIPRALHEAFHIARTGRPGPVLVDIPQDLSQAEIEYEPVTDVRLPGYQPRVE